MTTKGSAGLEGLMGKLFSSFTNATAAPTMRTDAPPKSQVFDADLDELDPDGFASRTTGRTTRTFARPTQKSQADLASMWTSQLSK